MGKILIEILSLYKAMFRSKKTLFGFVLFYFVCVILLWVFMHTKIQNAYDPANIQTNTDCMPADVLSWARWNMARVTTQISFALTLLAMALWPVRQASLYSKVGILMLTATLLYLAVPLLGPIFDLEPLGCMVAGSPNAHTP